MARSRFTKIPNNLMYDQALSPIEFRVWAVLASYCFGSSESCYPSVAKLVSQMGLSDRHFRRTIRSLEHKGYLSINHRPGANSVYIPQLPTPDTQVRTDTGVRTDTQVKGVLTRVSGGSCHVRQDTNKTFLIRRTEEDVQVPPSPSVPVVEDAPKSKSRKTKRAAKPTDPRIADIMAFYHDEHVRVLDEKPHIIGGRDASVIKRILQTIPDVDEIKSRIMAFIADPLSWMDTPNHSLALFEKRINAYSPYNRAKHSTSAIDEWLNEPDETLQ